MYRHEAIALARAIKDETGHASEELQPWVVDAVLRAANTYNDTLEGINESNRDGCEDRTPTPADAPDGVIDLNKESFDAICNAAAESKWIPPEYMRNDWVFDVCEFLRSGDESPAERTPVAWRRVFQNATAFTFFHGAVPPDASKDWQPLYAE